MNHEMNVQLPGQKDRTSEECQLWEIGKDVQSQIADKIKLYLKIKKAGKITNRHKYDIKMLPELRVRQFSKMW